MVTVVNYPPESETAAYGIAYSASGYPSHSGVINHTVRTKTRTGARNPDRFTQLRQVGYMSPLAYNAREQTFQISHGSYSWVWGSPVKKGSVTDTFGIMDTGGLTSIAAESAIFNKLTNLAVGKANEALRSQSMSLVEDLVEGRKTADMVQKAATTLALAARMVKAGRFSDAARVLGIPTPGRVHRRRGFSSNWLEYRYGWMPVLYEVHGAIELLDREYRKKKIVHHVKATASDRKTTTSVVQYASGDTGNYSVSSNLLPVRYNRHTNKTTNFSVTVGYVFSMKNDWIELSQGLGLTNPLLVAWELVPLSFIGDWFVNVSDVLSQLDAWVGKQFLSGYITKKLSDSQVRTTSFRSISTGYTLVGFTPAYNGAQCNEISRTVITNPPTVRLSVGPSLNLKRAIDAVSLLRQVLR